MLVKIFFLPSEQVISWNNITHFPLTLLLWESIVSILSFLVGVFFWKVYVLIQCMRTVCMQKRFILRLQPLNPDNSAGLQPLGVLSLKISRILLGFGLFVGLIFATVFFQPWAASTYLWWGIEYMIIYVVLATFLFFYPLLSAHNLMREQKDQLLDRLSASIGVLYSEFYTELANDGPNVEKNRIEQILNLRELYLEAGKMPIWPFDTETLIKFFGTVALPIFLILFQLIVYLYVGIPIELF